MRFQNCIFDLYGTLADIRTDEDAPELWTAMTDCYARLGACYSPAGLRLAFRRGVAEAEREAVRRGVPGGFPAALPGEGRGREPGTGRTGGNAVPEAV